MQFTIALNNAIATAGFMNRWAINNGALYSVRRNNQAIIRRYASYE
jgi:hypothetical protein